MGDLLVRDLPDPVKENVRNMASKENLSMNQLVVKAITIGIQQMIIASQKNQEAEDVYNKILALRKKIYKRHGLKSDSTKDIRWYRDNWPMCKWEGDEPDYP